MAADQRRKRLNGATLVGCNSREQHRAKKKNMGVNEDDSNINPHISLEWDGSQKMVVAKRDQIGISWNDLKLYIDSTTTSHNIPADVFVVPHGIYELKNLEDVLSYEVAFTSWLSTIVESEFCFIDDNCFSSQKKRKRVIIVFCLKNVAGLADTSFREREKSSYAVSS